MMGQCGYGSCRHQKVSVLPDYLGFILSQLYFQFFMSYLSTKLTIACVAIIFDYDVAAVLGLIKPVCTNQSIDHHGEEEDD